MRFIFVSLMFISVFISVFGVIDALFITKGSYQFAKDYGFEYLFYGYVVFFFWAGIALLVALVTRMQWGYPLALTWVLVSIAYTLLYTVAIIFDDTFTFQYVLATTPPAERDIAYLAQTFASPAIQISTKITNAVFIFFGFIYLWMTVSNREYFYR